MFPVPEGLRSPPGRGGIVPKRPTGVLDHVRKVAALLLMSSAACATVNGSMRAWVGSRDADLVGKWGAPTREITVSSGDRVLTWVHGHCEQSFTVSPDGRIKSFSLSRPPATD